MSKFHVNPNTGNPGACRAKITCPFGGDDEHFSSKEEAQTFYEKKQETIEHFNWKSKVPKTKGSTTLATYDPFIEEIPREDLWSNDYNRKFIENVNRALVGDRLVIENGQVWGKIESFVENSDLWELKGGPADYLKSNYNQGDITESYNLHNAILHEGARLERGGKLPTIDKKHRAGYPPQPYELAEEAKVINETFNSKVGASSREELEAHLDDHVAERWRETPPKEWREYSESLSNELGVPFNYGDDKNPSWAWRK